MDYFLYVTILYVGLHYYQIDVSEYLNDPMLLEQHAKEINQEIEQIKSQLAWIWYHVKDEDRKPLSDIIKSHIKGTSK